VCGILGTYDVEVDAGRWAAMSEALAHRGPDASGTWTGPDERDDDRRGAADRSKEIWHLLTPEGWYRQQGEDR
jgi:asparagine synthetase B (glutamine-hydrolysing)